MKKIIFALVVLLSVQFANAQVKPAATAKKAVESAQAASQDPKKAAKVATWLKLAKSYVDAYNSPKGNAMNMLGMGVGQQEVALQLAGEKPTATENIVLGGEPCIKEVYATRDYVYNSKGQFVTIIVTKPVVEDALAGALEAYKKAYEVDVKKSKVKDITEGIASISSSYLDEGMTAYMLGDNATASKYFGLAAEASLVEPYNQLNAEALYNAGYTALASGNVEQAKYYYEKCLEHNYYYENGEVFAKLGEIYTNLEQPEKACEILEQGFMKYPQSQSILIGLINYYLQSKQDTGRLFELISAAKANEPNNASLYYVEGNIYNELRQAVDANEDGAEAKKQDLLEKAVAAYDECVKINPEYEFGYIGKGVMFYNLAIEIQEVAANEMDNAKYEALVVKMEDALLNSLKPFESAYNMSKDDSLKLNIAEYLKNIYYRFYSKGAEYEEGYNKYNQIVKSGQVK
jgi:tetratricopeptide (TPR) repeat protein